MPPRGRWKQVNYTPEQKELHQRIEQHCTQISAALIVNAVREAFKEARAWALRDTDPEAMKQSFAAVLPSCINRHLRNIVWPKGAGLFVRPAFNATHTNVFSFMSLGPIKCIPAKLKSPVTQAGKNVYRRLHRERGKITLLHPEEEITALKDDIPSLLTYGYNWDLGVPAEPDFITLAPYVDGTQKYALSFDLIQHAAGKMARVQEEKVITPLIAPTEAEPVLATAVRRRNEPKKRDQVETPVLTSLKRKRNQPVAQDEAEAQQEPKIS